MKASELIQELQNTIKLHGDLKVVSGLHRTSCGEPIDFVNHIESSHNGKKVTNIDNNPEPVINLETGEDATHNYDGEW